MLDLLRGAAESGAPVVIVLAVVFVGLVKVVVQARLSLMRASDKREAIRQALHGRTKAERDQGRRVLEILEAAKPDVPPEARPPDG
jgi:hypothetical protein